MQFDRLEALKDVLAKVLASLRFSDDIRRQEIRLVKIEVDGRSVSFMEDLARKSPGCTTVRSGITWRLHLLEHEVRLTEQLTVDDIRCLLWESGLVSLIGASQTERVIDLEQAS